MSEDKQEPTGSIKVSQKPPTRAELAAVAEIPVLTARREAVPFGSLISQDPSRRTLLLFIRHFFCGVRLPIGCVCCADGGQNCQEYVRSLCESVTPATLAALPTPTDVVVVGCGQPELIDFYVEATGCPFPIYAEPTKRIYSALGMGRTLDLGRSRPDYMRMSVPTAIVSSIWQGLSQGTKALKGGDFWQVGGEFVGVDGAAVPDGAQGVDPGLDHVPPRGAIERGDQADPASVMFVGRAIGVAQEGGIGVPVGDGVHLQLPVIELPSPLGHRART